MSRACVFLTLSDPSGYVIDDDLAVQPLQALGWHVTSIPWDATGVDWRAYDAVVIRSTWDYHEAPDRFLRVLAAIEASGAPLFNPLHVVRWNVEKTYLRDLSERGVAIVPTVWRERLAVDDAQALFDELQADEIVIKPVVGANAKGAFRLRRGADDEQQREIESVYRERAVMAQPFVRSIETEGEFSLFYFNGDFSHAIVKTPRETDFRVQEEHGGTIRAVQPSPDLRAAGDAALLAIGEVLLYARVDLVRHAGRFVVMELELIEPSLYLRMDAAAPGRFARALTAALARAM